MTTSVGILNVTGYTGAELARILHAHPHVRIAGVTRRSAAGKRLPDVVPHLWPLDLPVTETLPDDVDVVLSTLPHAAAAAQLAPYVEEGRPVVDLSADFRLKRVEEYEAAYGTTHPAPHLLPRAVFGLPELHRDEVARAKLVAAPGCHATGVILALAPAFAAGIIEPGVIADTKTGLSGAGRALDLRVHFSEADESVMPYGLDGHRHLPEMTQELGLLAEAPAPAITFVPHYVPMTRGILSTCYATLKPAALGGGSPAEARKALFGLYRDFYRDAPFVHVSETAPSTKHVMGTNYCAVHPSVDLRTGRVTVASALDNLGKGAAGAVVQCMNLMLGLPETAGLQSLALFP
ncbi:MAG TPA: N-acetyl-gamma-glutamyl-phosphate reductase [Methylomirabilota bacterium]|nr:N-acetyl-gamma-glutamyl-phosphate reductase [Methylomirabilota bacterium]